MANQFRIPNNDTVFNVNQSIWMDSDIDALVAAFGGQGVLTGCIVTAQSSPAMFVDISAGTVRIAGTVYTLSGASPAITAAHATLPRIDLVVARTTSTFSVIPGTPAASPASPELPDSAVGLALIYVPAAVQKIYSDYITSKRLVLPTFNNIITGDLEVTGNFKVDQNVVGDLKFTDGLYDIGKSGATRPRDGFFSRNVAIGGALAVTGSLLLGTNNNSSLQGVTTGSVVKPLIYINNVDHVIIGDNTSTLATDIYGTALVFVTASGVVGKIHTSGGFSWGNAVDPGANNFSVGNGGGILWNGITAFDANYKLQGPNSSTSKAKAFAWDTYSDTRLKTNQAPLDPDESLVKVLALTPKSYKHCSGSIIDGEVILTDAGEDAIGFIAQDVFSVLPVAVTQPEDETVGTWSMNYSSLIPLLTSAVQALATRVTTLEGN